MRAFFEHYLRRPIGALFVAGVTCGFIATVLRIIGEDKRANGAGIALVAILVVYHVYWVWVPELPSKERP